MSQKTGLYLHWPYCDRICPYCDFNVVRARHVDEDAWRRVLIEDIEMWSERVGPRRLESLYFGGGTPSLMSPRLIGEVIDTVANNFDLPASAEITLEANPTDAEIGRFQEMKDAGVNRLSLGVQSFDDQQLQFLGRNHQGGAAQLAIQLANKIFDRVTYDLIYALPEETPESWRTRLRQAVEFGATHLSLYQLTIEPKTAFFQSVERGAWSPASEDMAAELYEVTQEMLGDANLPAYEVSNHATSGFEAVHNSLYWQGADWIGIGPGAHGRLSENGDRMASVGAPKINNYLSAAPNERYEFERLSSYDQIVERLSGGLRPVKGLEKSAFSIGIQRQMENVWMNLVQDGLMSPSQTHYQISQKGRLLTDHVVRELISVLPE